eukprot:c4759_g1_i1.p1 GENE.c4759_g1_i1~~c4759_g1_i1.p1  ORF type:complete len:303 (-),score=68.76 c4759_g1_i1:208-1116(-)
MATRNRTPQFLTIRHGMMRKRAPVSDPSEPGQQTMADGQKSLLNETGTATSDLPPVWVDTVEQVNEGIRRIKSRLQELTTAHTQHLLPGFDDVDGKEQEVEVLTAEISRLFKTCEAKIRLLGTTTQNIQQTQNEKKVLANQQSQLATQLSDLYTQFRKSQKGYLSKLKGQKQMESDMVVGTDEEQALDAQDSGFSQDQERIVRLNDMMLREREQEITKITQSIEDLAVLFKDLQKLVIDQGSILDRIDYNIEHTQADVNEAVVAIVKADKLQKQNKLMLCIYILLMLCGALALWLIIKHSKK